MNKFQHLTLVCITSMWFLLWVQLHVWGKYINMNHFTIYSNNGLAHCHHTRISLKWAPIPTNPLTVWLLTISGKWTRNSYRTMQCPHTSTDFYLLMAYSHICISLLIIKLVIIQAKSGKCRCFLKLRSHDQSSHSVASHISHADHCTSHLPFPHNISASFCLVSTSSYHAF